MDVPTYRPVVPPDEPRRLDAGTARLLGDAEYAAASLEREFRRIADPEAFVTALRLRDALRSAQLTGHIAMPVETWMTALEVSPHYADAGLTDDAEAGSTDGDAASTDDAASADNAASADDVEESVREHPVGRFILASTLQDREIVRGRRNGIGLLGAVSDKLTGRPAGTAEESLRQTEGFLTTGPGGPPYVRTAPPGEPLVQALWDWDRWVARPYEGPRLVKIASAHLVLELLQPYPRANGHLARLFSSGEMVRQGLVSRPVLSLAPWLDDQAEDYRDQIRAVVEGGPLEDWVAFFVRGVQEQAEHNLDLIGRIEDLRAELTDRSDVSATVREILAALPTSPVTTIRTLARRHGLKPKTIAQITRRLVAERVLRVVVEHPVKVFVCDHAMRVLTADHTVPPTDRQTLQSPPSR